MKLSWTNRGKFKNIIKVLDRYKDVQADPQLNTIGKLMVNELEDNTPTNTGELKNHWSYDLGYYRGNRCVNIINGSHREWPNLVIGLEYGHGTGTGGYVKGTGFVTKSMDNVQEKVSKEIGGIIKHE